MLSSGKRNKMQAPARHTTDETRDKIIAATKVVYEKNGTRGTTTRKIAEQAGVNEATIFRHFGSKQGLLDAMRDAMCPSAIFESTLSADLKTGLLAIATHLIETMHAQRAMICINMAENAQAESLQEEAPEWRGPMAVMQRMEEFFLRQIAQNRVRGDAHELAAYFLGICFSYVVARKIWNSYTIKPAEINRLVDIFLNGILPCQP
jgi:AcrR family transcriptional regulator